MRAARCAAAVIRRLRATVKRLGCGVSAAHLARTCLTQSDELSHMRKKAAKRNFIVPAPAGATQSSVVNE
jgi:hypothetical protein